MEWAVQNSCGIQLPINLTLNGAHLPDKVEEVYLGVSLGKCSITETQLLKRTRTGLHVLGNVR